MAKPNAAPRAPSTPRAQRNAPSRPTQPAAPAPATNVPATPANPTSAAPAQPWAPLPKYANTVTKANALPAVMPGQVLLSVAAVTARPGTAKAAALSALLANVGQPRPVVLQAVANSEKAWHQAQGRTPINISPSGWLRTLGAVFGAPAAPAS